MGLSEDRKSMLASLQAGMVPRLRDSGFTGSLPHFRRVLPDRTDLLSVQFDKWGGGFVVEISRAPQGDFQTPWGETVEPRRLTAHHLPPDERLRLGAKVGGDHWFRYDRGWFRRRPSFDELTEQVCELLVTQAEPWWDAGSSGTR